MKTKVSVYKYISSISKMTVLSAIIIIIISAFTFPSFLAEKGNYSGCDITISMHNSSATDSIFVTDVGFKIAGGWWARIVNDPPPLTPGGSINNSGPLHLFFSCLIQRRYRFKLRRGNTSLPDYCYFPSENGWTTNANVDFGDLNSHFRNN